MLLHSSWTGQHVIHYSPSPANNYNPKNSLKDLKKIEFRKCSWSCLVQHTAIGRFRRANIALKASSVIHFKNINYIYACSPLSLCVFSVIYIKDIKVNQLIDLRYIHFYPFKNKMILSWSYRLTNVFLSNVESRGGSPPASSPYWWALEAMGDTASLIRDFCARGAGFGIYHMLMNPFSGFHPFNSLRN